jgi:yecA family protein
MTTPKRRRAARKSAAPTKTTMADYAMSFDQLGLWINERAKSTTIPHPQATSLSMLEGAVAAVVAGPVSMMPEEWLCPLLGVDPDDFNHDTETFSAIAATLMRHNLISETLSTKPESFEPLFVRTPEGEVDARPWCTGFYAIMQLRLLDWSKLLASSAPEDSQLRPILFHCTDETGRPILYAALQHAVATSTQKTWREIRASVEAIRQFWMPIRFKRRN